MVRLFLRKIKSYFAPYVPRVVCLLRTSLYYVTLFLGRWYIFKGWYLIEYRLYLVEVGILPYGYVPRTITISGFIIFFLGCTIVPIRGRLNHIQFAILGGFLALMVGCWVYPQLYWEFTSWYAGHPIGDEPYGGDLSGVSKCLYLLLRFIVLRIVLYVISRISSGGSRGNGAQVAFTFGVLFRLVKSAAKGVAAFATDPVVLHHVVGEIRDAIGNVIADRVCEKIADGKRAVREAQMLENSLELKLLAVRNFTLNKEYEAIFPGINYEEALRSLNRGLPTPVRAPVSLVVTRSGPGTDLVLWDATGGDFRGPPVVVFPGKAPYTSEVAKLFNQ